MKTTKYKNYVTTYKGEKVYFDSEGILINKDGTFRLDEKGRRIRVALPNEINRICCRYFRYGKR